MLSIFDALFDIFSHFCISDLGVFAIVAILFTGIGKKIFS